MFKSGQVSESWIKVLNDRVKEALEKAIANIHWLVLPGIEASGFVFIIESDWSSRHEGYMLFASRGGEERLLDLGSRMQKVAVSSYLGELDALVWACKRTKAFRGMLPVVVRTDNHALIEKWRSQSLYDSDIRVFRRWGWLVANEPDIRFEFVPGSENVGADLLSRPYTGRGVKDTLRPNPKVHQISAWNEIWEEHMKGHWGAKKVFLALRRRGSNVSWTMVKRVCKMCEICAQFRHRRANAPYGQPFFSLEPGHTVFGDVIGPLPRGKGGAKYIHCLVDSATRLGDAMRMRDTTTTSIL